MCTEEVTVEEKIRNDYRILWKEISEIRFIKIRIKQNHKEKEREGRKGKEKENKIKRNTVD